MNEFTLDTPIGDLDARTIAGILQAQGGFFLKKYDRAENCGATPEGLIGIAQALYDMTKDGRFGTGLSRVARYHFAAPKERWHPVCLNAVEEVFLRGVKRNADWQILSLCTFSECADRHGEPDEKKAEDLLEKYDYLGKDAASRSEGIFYFGRKRKYRVCPERYILRENALLLKDRMESEGYPCAVHNECGLFHVLVGRFAGKGDAEALCTDLRARGYVNAKVQTGF